MRVLCNHFLPCVVGEKRWKMQIQAGKKVNEIATVSDEAFVLLILKNIWSDMEKVDIDDYYRPKKRKKETTMTTLKDKTLLVTKQIMVKEMKMLLVLSSSQENG